MQEMIKLENVTKVYKTGVRAVNDMSLTIDAGELFMSLVQLVLVNLHLSSFSIVKKKQQEVKLLLMEPMYLVLRTLKSHI